MFGLQSLSTSICLRCELRLLRQASRRFSAKPSSRIEASQIPITRYDPKRASVKRLRSRIHGTPGKKVREDSANIPIDSLGAPSEILILRDTDIGNTERKPSVKVWNKRSAASSKELLESLEKEKTVPDRQETIEQIEALRPTNGREDGEGGITIPQGQLDRLIDKLNESFIIRQLRLYYESNANKADQAVPKFGRDRKNLGNIIEDAEARRSADSADDLRSCTVGVWRPGKRPLEQRLKAVPHHLYSTAVPGSRQTAKLRLIHEIIGRSWKVQSEEDAQAVGQLEVGLKTWQLKLLSSGEAPTILDTIAANRAAQVEVYKPDGVIRITADRWTAEYAAGDLVAALENLHVMPVDLRPFVGQGTTKTEVANLAATLLGSETIRMIEGLTRTEIQAKGRSELNIRGFTVEAVTDAHRHIIQFLAMPQRCVDTVLWTEKASTKTLQTAGLVEGLPLRHRTAGANLLRWIKPVIDLQTTSADSKLQNDSTQPEDSKELDVLSKLTVEQRPVHFNGRLPVDSIQNVIADMLCSRVAFHVPERNSRTSASGKPKVRNLVDGRRKKESAAQSQPASAMPVSTHWLRTVTAEIDAALGQVLHRSEPDGSHLETATVNLVHHRVWSPHAPGVMQAMTWLTASIPEDQLGATQSNRLVFRYIPSPIPFGKNNNRDAMRTFPELHVHINKGTAEFMGMCLLLWSQHLDLMLPSHASDLRFTRRETLWTEAPGSGNEGAKDLIDAIVRSVKDPSAPLRAPQMIDLAIPAWTAIEKGRQVRGSNSLSVDPLVVRYMWAGVELREQVNMQLPNPPRALSYTAVQAGRIGGNWADFKLHLQELPTKTKGIDMQNQIAAREFFDQTLELTKVLDGSARRPVPLKSVKTKGRAVGEQIPAVEASQDFLSTSEGDAIDEMYAASGEDTASEAELLEDHDTPPRAAAVG